MSELLLLMVMSTVLVVVGVQVQWHGEHGVVMMVQAGGKAGRSVVVIGARGAFVLNGFAKQKPKSVI